MQRASPRPDRPALLAALGGLVVVAWAALAVWGRSPYARYLDHEVLEEPGRWGLPLIVSGWTLMIVAMMLPTTFPLVAHFVVLVRRHDDRRLLVGLLLAGYLAVWIVFGLAAHLGDLALHRLAEGTWVERNPWAAGAAVLALAGAYQFSSLKYRCLSKCRSPRMFILERWRGGRERRRSFSLGVDHGLYCVGCCWTLMLLMFAVGIGNVAWMLGLGAVMAIEKNLPWGRRLSVPAGVALLGSAVLVTGGFTLAG